MYNTIPFLILAIGAASVGLVAGCVTYIRKRRLSLHGVDIPLKKYGSKLNVRFDECEIKCREYFENAQNDSFPTRVEILDSLSKRNATAINGSKRSVCVIVYKATNPDGSTTTFNSAAIYLSSELLRYRLASKKETIIYFDPNDKKRYYFDVEFLTS